MEENQTIKQKMIELAQGGYDEAIIKIIRDVIPQGPIIGKDQWETTVNSITLDVVGSVLSGVVDRLKFIREGGLHDEQQ